MSRRLKPKINVRELRKFYRWVKASRSPAPRGGITTTFGGQIVSNPEAPETVGRNIADVLPHELYGYPTKESYAVKRAWEHARILVAKRGKAVPPQLSAVQAVKVAEHFPASNRMFFKMFANHRQVKSQRRLAKLQQILGYPIGEEGG